MPASGIKLVDANIWLALSFSDHVHHATAQQWFDKQPENVCAFCRLTQMALLRHLTNVKIMGKFVQTQQEAWNAYDALIGDPRVMFLSEPPGVDAEFRALSQSLSPSLLRWTDSYLAAVAKMVDAQVVTLDRGFKAFDGLDVALLS